MSDDQTVRKVLVVDDEPEVEVMFMQRMRREIRAGRYEFVFARSGRHALEVLKEHPDIVLVITDLDMPEMDGFALLEAMGEAWPGVPSLVVSAYGDDAHVARAREHGASGFIAKPVDFPALREMIATSFSEEPG